MPTEQTPGKPQTRRYSPDEKAAAVRMVRTLRAELGTEHGTVHRVATQLGYGVESVRQWVKQADNDDGHAPGVSTSEARRIKDLEQENRELRRASSSSRKRNAIASVCAVLDQTLPREEFRVVVVEQDGEAVNADLLAPCVDRYVFAPNSGEYNRSWGRNVGAVATRGHDEYLCLVDADLLLPRDFLEGCLTILRDGGNVGLLPQASLCYLDDISSDRAIHDRLSAPQRAIELSASRGYRLMTDRGGCIFVASREFHSMNGYDERYEGWGDEDNEFYERLESRGPIGQLAHDVVHLHHERPREMTLEGTRPNERLLGLEPDPLAVIGDPRRYSTSTSTED